MSQERDEAGEKRGKSSLLQEVLKETNQRLAQNSTIRNIIREIQEADDAKLEEILQQWDCPYPLHPDLHYWGTFSEIPNGDAEYAKTNILLWCASLKINFADKEPIVMNGWTDERLDDSESPQALVFLDQIVAEMEKMPHWQGFDPGGQTFSGKNDEGVGYGGSFSFFDTTQVSLYRFEEGNPYVEIHYTGPGTTPIQFTTEGQEVFVVPVPRLTISKGNISVVYSKDGAEYGDMAPLTRK